MSPIQTQEALFYSFSADQKRRALLSLFDRLEDTEKADFYFIGLSMLNRQEKRSRNIIPFPSAKSQEAEASFLQAEE